MPDNRRPKLRPGDEEYDLVNTGKQPVTLECTPHGLRLVERVNCLGHAELERLIGLPIAT